MHHAVYLRFVLSVDRQAVASVTHGDDGILQIRAAAVQDAVELRVDAVVDAVHGAADLMQAGARVVTDLILREDAALDFIVDGCDRFQAAEHRV